MEPERFKVIIIGGSIAGFTLAHCLNRAGIDYVVLEKRKEIAPQEGASIGILPHGGRILDQLGLFDAIEELVEPLHTAHICYPDGFKHTNRSPQVLHERFGLPMAFLERRKLLQVFSDSLPEPSRVQVGKKVVSVEQDETNKVTVRVEDGDIYRGDLVVGADGVHSRVRNEMWRLANLEQPGVITEREKNGMCVKYACLFGISPEVSNLKPGEQVATLNDGRSFLTFPGQDGRVFWFLMNKLDQKYPYTTAPRLSWEDTEQIAERYANDHIWNGVRFGDIWKRRQVFGATNLEENVFQTWHWGRVVCIGDSMHKMAPNTGQGANCAIEDAAALANHLNEAIQTTKHGDILSNNKIQTFLEQFSQARIQRVQKIYKTAKLVVRLHARQNLFLRLLGRYYVPYTGDLPADIASKSIAGAVHLDFLPLPQRSGSGWKDFSPERETMPRRAIIFSVLALLLGIFTWIGKDIRLLFDRSLGSSATYLHS